MEGRHDGHPRYKRKTFRSTKTFLRIFLCIQSGRSLKLLSLLKENRNKKEYLKSPHEQKKKHELYVKYTPTHSALLNPRQGEDFIKASEHVQKRKRDRKTTNSKRNKLSWGTTNKILKSPLQEPIIVFWSTSLLICWTCWLILWDFIK